MEVLNFILIAMFGIFSLCIVMMTIYKDDINVIDAIKIVFFIITTFLCFISILHNSLKLSDSDVFNGRAEYVETIHISKGDTVKTYHIQPKK